MEKANVSTQPTEHDKNLASKLYLMARENGDIGEMDQLIADHVTRQTQELRKEMQWLEGAAHDAVNYVGAANYRERQEYAHDMIAQYATRNKTKQTT